MSMIGGYYSRDKKRLDRSFLSEKVERFSFFSKSGENEKVVIHEYEFGHLFAKYSTDVRSMVSTASDNDKNIFLSIGYLFLKDWGNWDSESGKLHITQANLKGIESELPQTEGEYVAFFSDHIARQIHIINDRFASRPLFFLETPDKIYFCTNMTFLVSLACQKAQPDPFGIIQIFSFSHTLDTYTNIAGVKRTPPASHIIISPNGIKRHTYWKLRYEVDPCLRPIEHAEQTFHIFQEGVAKRVGLSGRSFLALSGGLDSRLIAGSLPEPADYPAYTLTDDVTQSMKNEFQTAAQVCQSLGLSHNKVSLYPGLLSNGASDVTRLNSGLIPMHDSIKPYQLLSQGFELIIHGGPGDVLIGAYVPTIYHTLPSRKTEYIDAYAAGHRVMSKTALCRIFNRDLVDTYFPQIESLMRKCLSEVEGPTAAHVISAWAMWFRQPAFTFSNPNYNHPFCTQVRPHLNYKYVDQILKLPAIWLFQKLFYSSMIYQCLPKLRSIVYANTGKLLAGRLGTAQRPLWTHFMKHIACTYMKSLTAKVRPVQKATETSSGHFLISEDMKFLNEITEILHSYPICAEIFNVQELDKYINLVKMKSLEHNAGDCSHSVGCLASILYFIKLTKTFE